MAFGDLVQAKRGTTSVTLTSSPTSGNLLVFMAASSANVTFTAPTGFTGGTAVATSGGNSRGMQAAWKISAGTETGAISPASGTPTYCTIAEYTGPFAATPKDVENNQLIASPFDSPSVTPTSGVQRLIVAAQAGENTGDTWGIAPLVNSSSAGVVIDTAGAGDGRMFHLVVASTSGSYITNGNQASGSAQGSSAIMIFAPGGRTTKNTRAFPLGTEIGMNWVNSADV